MPPPLPSLSHLNLPPADVAVLLGSGLATVFGGDPGRSDAGAEAGAGVALEGQRDVPYGRLPGLAAPTVAGHPGVLSLGVSGGARLAVFRGRLHLYEGLTPAAAAAPVAVAAALGAHTLVVTNAAGGLNPAYREGDLVLIEDHLNLPGLVGHSPLAGAADFLAMEAAYSPELRAAATDAAARLGLRLARGVYAMVGGPAYETLAEQRLLRTLGADLVGMSTANEVVLARALGLRVLGISVVTNSLAGPPAPPDHGGVLAVAARAARALERLLVELIPTLAVPPA